MRTNFESNCKSSKNSLNKRQPNSSKGRCRKARTQFITIFEVLDDDERQRFTEKARARVERLTGRPASIEGLESFSKSYVLKSGCSSDEFVSILESISRDEMCKLMEKSDERKRRITQNITKREERRQFSSVTYSQQKKSVDNNKTQKSVTVRQPQQKAVFDVTKQVEGEKRLKSVTNENYDHVSDESLMVLAKIECKLLDFIENAPSVPHKKSQAQVDLEIVKKFYDNPTQEAFAGLWKRYRWGVQSHISKFVGDWTKSDDLVQDTFQKAWEKRFMFDPLKASFSTWLYTIARNLTFTQLKKDGQNRTIDVDVNDVYASALYPNGENASTVDEAYYIVNSPDDVETNTFDDITHKMYEESVARVKQMDPLFQKVLIMKNLRGMTLREISEALDIRESKIKNLYYKSRDALCETIKKECGDLYNIYVDAAHDHAEEENQMIYG